MNDRFLGASGYRFSIDQLGKKIEEQAVTIEDLKTELRKYKINNLT